MKRMNKKNSWIFSANEIEELRSIANAEKAWLEFEDVCEADSRKEIERMGTEDAVYGEETHYKRRISN